MAEVWYSKNRKSLRTESVTKKLVHPAGTGGTADKKRVLRVTAHLTCARRVELLTEDHAKEDDTKDAKDCRGLEPLPIAQGFSAESDECKCCHQIARHLEPINRPDRIGAWQVPDDDPE